MDESRLRELASELEADLPNVIEDEQERRLASADIAAALAKPEGAARSALLKVLRARPETRAWAAARTGDKEPDIVRAIPGLPGAPAAPIGVHYVCPNCDYDLYLDKPTDRPGHCPHDGRALVRADD
jgi:hypothetical protein